MRGLNITFKICGKYLLALLFTLSLNFDFLFSQTFKIEKVDCEISGQTQEKFLRDEVLIDTERTFSSKEELDAYIADCKSRLLSLRIFSDVSIEIEKNPLPAESKVAAEIIPIHLKIRTEDSKHFLLLPQKWLRLVLLLLKMEVFVLLQGLAAVAVLVAAASPEEEEAAGAVALGK